MARILANLFALVASEADATVYSPQLTKVSILADDETGNLRDPSGMIQDPKTGRWHFWVVFVPGSTKPGWAGYLHHYSADAIEGPFTNHGLALNHSSDSAAFDYSGMFSSSALYDEEEAAWYLFYSGTGANDTATDHISAQLVASAPSADGPWTRLGLVAYPTGPAGHWNARRTDSGRAMRIGGQRGYWTKGCRDGTTSAAFTGVKHTCAEGAYFPLNQASWRPPYAEWKSNPIYEAKVAPFADPAGYENCEFFRGPKNEQVNGSRPLHVLCQAHSSRKQPHFITDASGLHWTLVNTLNTAPAAEPTPVYHGAVPGDEAEVTHFIARVEGPRLTVGLFKLDWVPSTTSAIV